MRNVTCFACGITGHLKRNCPTLQRQATESLASVRQPTKAGSSMKREGVPRAVGRAYNITPDEARDDPKVVTGTFLVNSHPAHVLFDSGASDCFVSLRFAKSLQCAFYTIDKPFYVDTAGSV
ncbi:hypothetical protein E9993_22995, partial [Labilibacter sediminis]